MTLIKQYIIMSINKVILVGFLGKDPEVHHLESGVATAKFSLATSENFKNKNGEKVTTTEWHNIVLWRGLAEVAEKFLKKGMQVYIEGKIKTRSWDDKEGNKRYTTEIVGDVMQLLGKKDGTNETEQQKLNEKLEEINNANLNTVADDLPF
jgi:single-strand DNA-binding protein